MRITEVMIYDAAGGPDAEDVIVAVIPGQELAADAVKTHS